MIESIITIVFVLFGIMVSIALHELGHMVPAKLFKVPVSEYFIGFGPTLFAKKIGETIYGIKAILLGGYTKIIGMFPQKPSGYVDKRFAKTIESVREEALVGITPENEHHAFYNLTMPKKMIVMAGGTLMNLFLGFLCFVVAFSLIGGYSPSTTLKTITKCEVQIEHPESSGECSSNYAPAQKAGLKAGDKIVAVNNHHVSNFNEIATAVSGADSSQIKLSVEKAGTNKVEDITVDAVKVAGSYKIGISPEFEKKKLSPFETLSVTKDVVWQTIKAVVSIPITLVETVKSIVTGHKRSGGLLSIVGLGQVAVAQEKASETIGEKIAGIFSIMGSLNVGLFVLNLIPLLPLDGGHFTNALYEGIKRGVYKIRKKKRPGPSDLARSMPLAYLVYGLLMLLCVVLVVADIVNPIV
ncbi:MAG: site-2 protease family protein [Candidatus Ancillula sp.]|jgi:membrane-associated protease RseP (regulator of RpoE activity)|nr:site-2 protease family protein [Candidatus Ancillula sp.]